jgi:Domain of unknown function (DUF4335)
MVMRRKYSLPNCTLILEGLSETPSDRENPSILSVLVNAECHLQGYPQPLGGGRDFLESLVRVVSRYTQEILSGVRVPPPPDSPPELIQLAPIDKNLHRLTAMTDPDGTSLGGIPRHLDLNSVQLFDLVEAIDQFLEDSCALPDWSLGLQPIPRKYANTGKPLVQRAAPVALGVSSLAAAALVLSFLPIPKEIRRPEEPVPQSANGESVEGTQANSGTGEPPTSTPPAEPAITAESASPSPKTSPSEAKTQSSPASEKKESEGDLPKTLGTPEEITDPTQLNQLRQSLAEQIRQESDAKPTAESDLVYRVNVGQDGSVIGYKPENQAAKDYQGETPLTALRYVPTEGGTATAESQAEFRVVFKNDGALEVSPLKGYSGKPSPPPEITDDVEVRRLAGETRSLIYDNWKTEPIFERELEFRVGVTEDGKIVEYEPINQPAYDYGGETPLSELRQSGGALVQEEGELQQKPLAQFKVVFTPKGVVEISPWKGW